MRCSSSPRWHNCSRNQRRVLAKREAFKAHVAEMIDKLQIEVLAEEFSEEGKGEPEGRETAVDDQSERAKFETAVARCNYETVLEQFVRLKALSTVFVTPTTRNGKHSALRLIPRRRRNQIGVSGNKCGYRESRTANAGACCSCAGTITTTPSRNCWRVTVSMCGMARITTSATKSLPIRTDESDV